jgi:hypothetical protein
MASNFVITNEISVNGNKITKFRSSKTGLSVVHVDNEGEYLFSLNLTRKDFTVGMLIISLCTATTC